jgi:hypothetical protein
MEMVIHFFSKSGVFDILEVVGVDSFSEFSVSRGKICIPLSENSVVPTLSARNSQTVFSTARFPQLTRRSGSARASPHSAPSFIFFNTGFQPLKIGKQRSLVFLHGYLTYSAG